MVRVTPWGELMMITFRGCRLSGGGVDGIGVAGLGVGEESRIKSSVIKIFLLSGQ